MQTSGALENAPLDKMFPPIIEAEQKSIAIDAVMLKICGQHGITIKDLRGPSRKRDLVLARRNLATVLKRDYLKTVADIGRLMHRDHSTVVSLLKSAKISSAT